MDMLPIVIVIAPQGAGKTQQAHALAERFGCTSIVEEWDGVSELSPGALALTHCDVVHSPQPGDRGVSYVAHVFLPGRAVEQVV